MVFFTAAFVVLGLAAVALEVVSRRGMGGGGTPTTPDFKRLQRLYLAVYFMSVMGDWLQGPYVYALYEHYQFSKQQIAWLFIVGFGSSMIFGPFAGQAADKYGRKMSCMIYCALYIVSCMTKHSPDFYVLLFGRLTGGMATSILFSSFESWYVSEHNKSFYPSEWLSQTFSLATTGNSAVAIVAGQLGNAVKVQFNSLVAPFDAAIVFLTIAMGVIWTYWGENKGESATLSAVRDPRSKLKIAMDAMTRDPKIMLLGGIQSCFEGSMYIFVFMWTPKLEPLFPGLPHGQVFACFMTCSAVGSGLLRYIQASRGPALYYMREVYVVAALALGIPALPGVGANVTVMCFFIFEVTVGVYFPSMGGIKAMHVPEEVRATIYNIFRMPLNLIVLLVLSNIGTISDDVVFAICALLLFAAAFMQHLFIQMVKSSGGGSSMGPAAAATEDLAPLVNSKNDDVLSADDSEIQPARSGVFRYSPLKDVLAT
mmetsp:Transcript_10469/g.25508  ORF Transcript_10469/g.25508 Transcript_10469/m.25508 type:complete len:483 (+) Transcript_10469:33-1481(+)